MKSVSEIVVLPELSRRIIGCFYTVYNELGHGFLEAIYRRAMTIALAEAGLSAREESPVTIWFHGAVVGSHRVDHLVEEQIILEYKAGVALSADHHAQLLHYLTAADLPLGILLNFGPKPTFKRLAHTERRH